MPVPVQAEAIGVNMSVGKRVTRGGTRFGPCRPGRGPPCRGECVGLNVRSVGWRDYFNNPLSGSPPSPSSPTPVPPRALRGSLIRVSEIIFPQHEDA